MKEISCIQQYVIDNLINDKRLSVENLIDAVIKTCSTLFKVRILDKHVGLISIHTEQVRTGKLKILICKIVLVQTLKSCSITIFHILMQ